MPSPARPAFTLVELLVVVAIIVILLALLAPAMDQAVYQAELAMCGAKLHALAGSVQNYAFNARRRYPYRLGVSNLAGERPTVVAYNGNPVTGNKEDRPMFRSFLDINEMFNCPLVTAVDLDGSHNDTLAYSSYALWFDWRYRFPEEKGMYRIGDRFTWTAPPPVGGGLVVNRFSVLASDWDQLFRANPDQYGNSHPDKSGVMAGPAQLRGGCGVQSHLFDLVLQRHPARRCGYELRPR
jgi:prepilin-type N-terminal cleavage/methylation domain-containing protein